MAKSNITPSSKENKKEEKKLKVKSKQFLEDIKMIDSHKTNERVEKLEKGMTTYFEMMKEETQIVQALQSSDTEDESSFALKRLRPREVMISEEKGKTLKFKDLIRSEN